MDGTAKHIASIGTWRATHGFKPPGMGCTRQRAPPNNLENAATPKKEDFKSLRHPKRERSRRYSEATRDPLDFGAKHDKRRISSQPEESRRLLSPTKTRAKRVRHHRGATVPTWRSRSSIGPRLAHTQPISIFDNASVLPHRRPRTKTKLRSHLLEQHGHRAEAGRPPCFSDGPRCNKMTRLSGSHN